MIVLCDPYLKYYWSHDNDTVSGMEYRDSTAISKVYMKRVDLRARPEGGRVFSLAPRRLDSFAVASNMFTTGLRSLSVRRFFRCCHAVCSCQLTAERFNCKLCSVESRNRYRHVVSLHRDISRYIDTSSILVAKR